MTDRRHAARIAQAPSWPALLGYGAVFAIAACVVLTPLFLVRFPAMIDYPVHLARQFILTGFHQSTAYQAGYSLDWGIKPNLAMDLAVPLMARWMPVEIATKVFVALAMLSPILGASLLSTSLGTSARITALISLCFVYHLAVVGGFVNFVLGIGMAMGGLALWIKLDANHPTLQSSTSAWLVILTFFTHLFALGVYLLLVISYEIGKVITDRSRINKQLLPLALIFTLSMVLWFVKPSGPDDGHILYGSLRSRVSILFSPFISQTRETDLALLLLFLAGLFLLFKTQKRLPIVREMRLPLLALLLAALLMPNEVAGGAVAAIRIPIALMFVLIASLTTQRVSVKHARILTMIALLFMCARSLQVLVTWQGYDAKFQEFVSASTDIPAGSRIIAMHEIDSPPHDPHLWHLVTLSAMTRCTFVPHMAKLPDQHPIIPSPATRAIDGGAAIPMTAFELNLGTNPVESEAFLKNHPPPGWSKAYYVDWPHHFDYLVHVYDTDDHLLNPDPRHLEPVSSGSFFTIYRVTGRPEHPTMTCAHAS